MSVTETTKPALTDDALLQARYGADAVPAAGKLNDVLRCLARASDGARLPARRPAAGHAGDAGGCRAVRGQLVQSAALERDRGRGCRPQGAAGASRGRAGAYRTGAAVPGLGRRPVAGGPRGRRAWPHAGRLRVFGILHRRSHRRRAGSAERRGRCRIDGPRHLLCRRDAQRPRTRRRRAWPTAPPPAPAPSASPSPACPAGSRTCAGCASRSRAAGRARSRARSSRW